MSQRRATLLPVLVLLWAARVSAATVVLVPPALPSTAMSEALVRVRGELVSEGFAVEVVDASREGDLRAWIDQLGSEGHADAVVAMLGDQIPDSVEIRIVDPHTRRLVVRRMPFRSTPDAAGKLLAIHTLELVRATFFEMNLVPAPRPPQPLSPSKEPLPWSELVSLDLGGTAIFDLAERAPAVLPLVRFSWALRPWLLPHLTVAALGTRGTIRSEGASAEVSRQFALVGGDYRFRAASRLRPFLSFSVGVLHTSAQGQVAPPDQGRQAAQWSLLVDGAAGAWLALSERLHVTFALEAQLAEPYPAIRFSSGVVQSATRPSLLLTVTVGMWL